MCKCMVVSCQMLAPYPEPSSPKQYKYQEKDLLLFNVVFTLDSKSVMVECLLSCTVLGFYLFISTYKGHINVVFCMIIFNI